MIVANLLVLVALAFVYPHLMVSPGPLVPDHAALATDCFACHAPLRGASTDRCIACHELPDIGLRTTKGLAIKAVSAAGATQLKMSFHKELTEQNCMACHSGHAGPKLTQRGRKPFLHALLRVETRDRCESCHTAPRNDMHQKLSIGCAQCHKAEAWKPASFDHAAGLRPSWAAAKPATRRRPTPRIARSRAAAVNATHPRPGSRPLLSTLSFSFSTRITTLPARPATPPTTSVSTPAMAATSTRRPTCVASTSRKAFRTSRTAWNATAVRTGSERARAPVRAGEIGNVASATETC